MSLKELWKSLLKQVDQVKTVVVKAMFVAWQRYKSSYVKDLGQDLAIAKNARVYLDKKTLATSTKAVATRKRPQ